MQCFHMSLFDCKAEADEMRLKELLMSNLVGYIQPDGNVYIVKSRVTGTDVVVTRKTWSEMWVEELKHGSSEAPLD